jgi:hypothetical protein
MHAVQDAEDTIPPADLVPMVALVDNRTSLVWFMHRTTEQLALLCQAIDKVSAKPAGFYLHVSELDAGEHGYTLFDATRLPVVAPGKAIDRDTLVEKAPLLGHYKRVSR